MLVHVKTVQVAGDAREQVNIAFADGLGKRHLFADAHVEVGHPLLQKLVG